MGGIDNYDCTVPNSSKPTDNYSGILLDRWPHLGNAKANHCDEPHHHFDVPAIRDLCDCGDCHAKCHFKSTVEASLISI